MARLILPTVKQWIVLEKLGLTSGSTDIVLVTPWVTHDLTKEGGDLSDPLGLKYLDIVYDDGGEPDVVMDIIRGHDHSGINQLRKHANLPYTEDNGDDELDELDTLELERDWVEFDMDWDDDGDRDDPYAYEYDSEE